MIEDSFTDRVLRSITEHFEDLGHFPSGSQVHPETGHGTPCGQADYTGEEIEGDGDKGLKKYLVKYLFAFHKYLR